MRETYDSRLAPSDAVVAAILLVVTVTFTLDAATSHAAALHGAILLAFAILISLAAWRPRAWWAPWLRSLATVSVVLILYSSIAEPAFVVMGGARDAALARIDRFLFAGLDPALVVARHLTPFRVELFAFIYGWFIPYLYISIFLGCFGRPERERRTFLLGLAITYAVAYLGYLYVPARGPIEHQAFATPLEGGIFLEIVRRSVEATGGNHGAFPSLHVGATLYLTLFDLRYNTIRGMTYVPVVIMIAISTIVLRYHYVIDLVAGGVIAWIALALAERWKERRATEVP